MDFLTPLLFIIILYLIILSKILTPPGDTNDHLIPTPNILSAPLVKGFRRLQLMLALPVLTATEKLGVAAVPTAITMLSTHLTTTQKNQ